MKAAPIVEVVVKVKTLVQTGQLVKPNHFFGVFTDFPTRDQLIQAINERAKFDDMPSILIKDLLSFVERLPIGEALQGTYSNTNGSVMVKKTLLFSL